jgi:hypothetical protein
MRREIDAAADEFRKDAQRAKRAARVTADPKAKRKLNRIADADEKEAIDIENDLA